MCVAWCQEKKAATVVSCTDSPNDEQHQSVGIPVMSNPCNIVRNTRLVVRYDTELRHAEEKSNKDAAYDAK